MEISETEGDARETACDLRASVCTLMAGGIVMAGGGLLFMGRREKRSGRGRKCESGMHHFLNRIQPHNHNNELATIGNNYK